MAETYEILDGVRRAKASQLAGTPTITARLFDQHSGKLLREFAVTIERLRSPHKHSIRRITRADQIRWDRVEKGAGEVPVPFPPISIVEGDRGLKIESISFDFGGSP